MSYKYSDKSLEQLHTIHLDLQYILFKAISIIDITVLEGARSDIKQNKMFDQGLSKLDGITKRSKHQVSKDEPLSYAVDIAPYPVSFSNAHKNLSRFYYLAGIIKAIADDLYNKGDITHKIRWGGDWNSNNRFDDQTFDDLVHFELVADNG